MSRFPIRWAFLGGALIVPLQAAQQVFVAEISSASPSTFVAGQATSVTVRLRSTNGSGNVIIEADSWPSGWSVSPKNRNPTITQNVSSDQTFTVTPPATGSSSGTIVWKLYDDDFGVHPSGSRLLATRNQSISSSPPSFTVSASAGSGGSVSPSSRTVVQSSTTTFTVSPSTGYQRSSVSGDASGGSWSGNVYTTAPVSANRSLTFSFVPLSYVVSASASTGGTVSPSSRTVNHSSTTTFTVSPSTGYQTGTVSGDAAGGSWSGNVYTTAPVTQARSLTFSFTAKQYTFTASAVSNGSVSPSSRTVSHGATTTFTASPASGYKRGSVSGDASGGSWNGNVYTTATATQSRTLSFSFEGLPDLVISSLTPTATNASFGQTVTITSTTKNIGPAATGVTWCTVRYYLGRTSGELWREIGSGLTPNALEVNGISVNEEETDSLSWTVPSDLSAGTYYLTAVADADGDVEEWNESNNRQSVPIALTPRTFTVTALAGTEGTVSPSSRQVIENQMGTFTVTPSSGFTVNTTVAGDAAGGTWNGNVYTTAPVTQNRTLQFSFSGHPDVIISSLTSTAASGIAGQSVRITSITKNVGTADTGLAVWCDVRYYLGRTPGERWREIGSGLTPNLPEVNGISVNEEEADELSWTISSDIEPGRYYLTAVADADGEVGEGNENNNSTSIVFDILAQEFTVTASAGAGGSVSPTSRTVQQGQTTTFTATPASGYRLGDVTGDGTGGSWSANVYRTAPVTKNRVLEFAFLGIPDLTVSRLTSSAASGFAGQSIELTSVTKNGGTAGTGFNSRCHIRYYLGRTSGERWQLLGVGLTPNLNDLNGLTVGEEDEDSISWTIPSDLPAGQYYLTAVADADGEIPESDESNNATTTSFTVVLETKLLQAFWLMPLDVSQGDATTMVVEVSGLAVGSSISFEVFEDDGATSWSVPGTLTGTVYAAPDGRTYAKVTWTAQWQDDWLGDPEFFFRATRGNVSIASSRDRNNELIVRRNRQQTSVSLGDFSYSPGAATEKADLTDDRIPLILIHGLGGDEKPDSREYWYFWCVRLNENDMRTRFRVYRYIYDSRRSITSNADDFASFLEKTVADHPALAERQFTVLAHSMGGLVVRCAMNRHAGAAARIHRLLTLGTPHLGSPGANPSWVLWPDATTWTAPMAQLTQFRQLVGEIALQMNFKGTEGEFDLGWYKATDLPVPARGSLALFTTHGMYNTDLLQRNVSTPFLGSATMTATRADAKIIAYAGNPGIAPTIGLISQVDDGIAEEFFSHALLWLSSGVVGTMQKSDLSFVGRNDGIVPRDSALITDGHEGVERIDLTEIYEEHLDHSAYLDLASTIDHVAARLRTMVTANVLPGVAGAGWRLAGGTWQKPGVPLNALAPGSYTIEFKPVAGYRTPPPQTVTAASSEITSVTANYEPETHPPTDIFLSATTIAENRTAGTSVGALSTLDADTGDSFTYALVPGADHAAFAINGDMLVTAAPFDFETKNLYQIRVRSTDQTGLSFEKTFSITVGDANEIPRQLSLSAAVIAENAAVGTTVGELFVQDPDLGDTWTYSFVEGDGSADNVRFALDGKLLRTTAVLDHETMPAMTVRIRATDAGGLSVEAALPITVTNVNEAPYSLGMDRGTVVGPLRPGVPLAIVSAVDPDLGDSLTYSLVSGDGADDNIRFVLENGVLQVAGGAPLSEPIYRLRIQARDTGDLTVETAALLYVAPAEFSMTISADGAGNYTLRWKTTPGCHYQLQFTDDLVKGPWTNLGPEIVAGPGDETATYSDTAAGRTRFYRLMRLVP